MDHEPVSAETPLSSDEHDQLAPFLPDDHELLTHIVLEGFPTKNGQFLSAGPTVEEARTSGIAINSLCGKLWAPNRSPSDHPLCKTCIEQADEFDWPIPRQS